MRDHCLQDKHLFDMVMAEHHRQIDKWGIQEHNVSWWLTFLGEEYGETCDAAAEHHFRGGSAKNVVKEAIQTATLALKIAEAFQKIADEEVPGVNVRLRE